MPIYTHRDERFYTEVMIVTIMSVAAARLWSGALDRLLDNTFGDSLYTDVLGALIFTVIAVFLLNFLFAVKKPKPSDVKNIANKERVELEGIGPPPKDYGMFYPMLQGND